MADGVNGVFNDTPGFFPSSTYHNANYFRDVLFTPLTAFEQWKASSGLPVDAAATSDTDHDGLPLLLEYALGLDPLNANRTGLPTPALAGSFLSLTYRKNKAATDITVVAEVSDDLMRWLSAGTDVEQRWQVIDGSTYETITVRDKTPGSSSARRFMRLKITQP